MAATSFAPTMLHIAANSFHVIGQGINLVSGIYLGEIFFKSARKLIEALPAIIRRVDVNAEQAVNANGRAVPKKEVSFDENISRMWNYTAKYSWQAVKLCGCIAVGLCVKQIGTWCESDRVVNFFVHASSH